MTAPSTVTIRAPFAIRKRGGRKVIVTPDGAPAPPPEARPPRVDNALVKALARAFRWRRMLESGDYGSIAELARAERIGRAYVGAMLRLTLLAPDIVEAILEGRQGDEVTLEAVMAGVPAVWGGQAAWSLRKTWSPPITAVSADLALAVAHRFGAAPGLTLGPDKAHHCHPAVGERSFGA